MPRARLRRLIRVSPRRSKRPASSDVVHDALRLALLEVSTPASPAIRSSSSVRPGWRASCLRLPARSVCPPASLEAGGGVGAGLALGEAEFQSGRHAEAEQVLAGLVPQCTGDGERAAVANALDNLGMLMGDHAAAEAVLNEALAALAEPAPRLRLLARRAAASLWTGESGSASPRRGARRRRARQGGRAGGGQPSRLHEGGRARFLLAAATKRSPSPPPASTCTAAAATTPSCPSRNLSAR